MINGKKILAIDDEQVILDSIVKLCSLEGWFVSPTDSATKALGKIRKEDYDLIICDIMMPNMDGFQFLEHLRLRKYEKPVIITTGYSTVENAVKSLYYGATDFLPKPFSLEELTSIVTRALKYGEIQQKMKNENGNKKELLYYVPCPAKYNRLGYASWMFLENDGSVKIGITDLYLKTITSLKQIELFDVDAELIQGNACAYLETKSGLVHQLLSPLSGRILERNDKVIENYHLVQKDPYFNGWLYTIVPTTLEYETKHLVPCSSDRL